MAMISLAAPSDYFVTFIDDLSIPSVCEAEEVGSIEHYPYRFDADVNLNSFLNIPRNILYFNEMPICRGGEWNYYTYTAAEQENFIRQHFPDKLDLYRTHQRELFIYLWMYINGGVYISEDYEIVKPIDEIIDNMNYADLYFMLDSRRFISDKIFASQPLCNFWLEVVNLISNRTLTDMVETTKYKYELLPRRILDPYTVCNRNSNHTSYLKPVKKDNPLMAFMKCKTGGNDERLYVIIGITFVMLIMIVTAIIAS